MNQLNCLNQVTEDNKNIISEKEYIEKQGELEEEQSPIKKKKTNFKSEKRRTQTPYFVQAKKLKEIMNSDPSSEDDISFGDNSLKSFLE